MEIVFDLRKSLPENAKGYYERAKKLKGKIPGMNKAIGVSKKKLEAPEEPPQTPKLKLKAQRKWYEKFRWFVSSQGYLVLGGRDATTNEILIKKHLEQNDLVFHADIAGAPFFIVKNAQGGEIPAETRRQAAEAAASYSRLWASGTGSADVYEVRPEQVSKTPPSGEYLTKGAFMIYGEKAWHRGVELKVAVGLAEAVIGGPVDSVKSKTKTYVALTIGDAPQGALAKQVKARIGDVELDDIQRFLPPGGGRII